MKNLLVFSFIVSIALLVGGIGQLNADATVTSYAYTCDSFTASGTTDAPYVGFAVYTAAVDELIAVIFPANGDFSHTVTFPPQPDGTELDLYVFGLLANSFQGYDQGLYFQSLEPCVGSSSTHAGAPCANLFDGRVNDDQSLDCAAPVAIYMNEDLGTVDIFAVNPDTGEGSLVIRFDPADMPPADANVLLQSGVNPFTGASVALYRLTTGEYQLTTTYADGKAYSFVWNADGQSHHLAA